MVYRYEIARNRRVLLLPVASAALVGASIALAVFVNPPIGLISLVLTGYIGYHLMKFFKNHVTSQIRVTDEGLFGMTSMGSKYQVDWKSLSVAGWFTTDDHPPELFFYAEEEDQLIRIPPVYSDPERMVEEVKEYVGELVELSGEEPGDLEAQLRERFTEPE